MTLYSIYDDAFKPFGVPLPEDYDTAPLLDALRAGTPKPDDGVVYVPSDAGLESQPLFAHLQDRLYGGIPIQVGYCNGNNHVLNALEYHRGSEVNIADDEVILLLADLRDVTGGKLDTAKVKAFVLPKGKGALLYETTLHYAPCNGEGQSGFRVVIVLPKDTNTDIPAIEATSSEDKLLWARNKWLLAHPDAPEAGQGAYVGLTGDNLRV